MWIVWRHGRKPRLITLSSEDLDLAWCLIGCSTHLSALARLFCFCEGEVGSLASERIGLPKNWTDTLLSREEAVYDISWQTPACARIALQHYNSLNEDKLELVKAVDSITFFYNGQWMHANFLAKSKGGTSCADLVPKSFFAELKMVPGGNMRMACVSCIHMDQDNPETRPVRGCGICPSRIFHPAAVGHIGARRQGASRQASNVDATANA